MYKIVRTVYNIYGITSFVLDDNGVRADLLRNLLSPFQVDQSEQYLLELILCRHKQDIPDTVYDSAVGSYKGIPWELAFERVSDNEFSRIYFCAPFFVTFLVVRKVLVPFIKQALVKQGGVALLGSVFHFENKTFLLYGQPGSGKTKLTLNALELEGEFIGDNELLITPTGEILPLFSEVELRYKTVRDTCFWSYLSIAQKIRLLIYQLISLLTLQFISFNISVPPDALNIKPKMDLCGTRPGENLIIVNLSKNCDECVQLPPKQMISLILGYEDWYQELYGNIFFGSNLTERYKLEQNMISLFAKITIWELPTDSTIEKILALPNQNKSFHDK